MSCAPMTPAGRPEGARPGFTLAELLVVLVLVGIVAGGIMSVVVKQQRFYRDAGDLIETRGQLRQAVSILPIELRAVYPRGSDIYQWSDSSIEFRSTVGSSVLCLEPALNSIILPPVSLEKGHTLSAWMQAPQVDDSVLIYDDGIDVGNADDSWIAYGISAVATAAGLCPVSSGLTTANDLLEPAYQLTLGAPLAATTRTGSAIRLFRRTRFALYRASDSRWYLGANDCMEGRTPACATIQPVSGPYQPYAAPGGQSGIRFTYFDSTGTELDPATSDRRLVARIDIIVRGETRAELGTPGLGEGRRTDSVSFVVGLRNRN
ncbi:MAG: prepilin-type N-terminal cleavage/methylation domain-containing protein [Gemmatimonadaceae bacterium]